MSTKSNKDVAIKYFNEVVNHKNLDLISAIFSQDYLSHGMDGKDVHSIQDNSLISFLKYFFRAFPDIQYTIDHIIAEEDIVAIDLTATGTQRDEFLGHAASLKRIRFKEMYFFRILKNRIVEGWGLPDVAAIKRQISSQD